MINIIQFLIVILNLMDLITCQYCIWYSQWIKLLNKEFFDANSKSRVVDKLKIKEKIKVRERNVFLENVFFFPWQEKGRLFFLEGDWDCKE